MKAVKRILLVLVLLLVIGGVVVYFYLDHILKTQVETQATNSLLIPTTLDSAHLSIMGQEVTLSGLNIGSPKGYNAVHMLELGKLDVAVKYSQLRKDPIHISKITIDKPHFVIEQAGGKINFKTLIDLQPPTTTPPPKVIIDELYVNDAVVDINLGELPGGLKVKNISVPIPSLQLKNIGNADGAGNGAAIKDVVAQLVTALADKASSASGIGGDLSGFLKNNVMDMARGLGGNLDKQLTGLTGSLGDLTKNVPIPGVGKDMGKSVDDLKKNIPNVGGLLGGDKKK